MKLVVAIVHDRDAGPVIDELVSHGYGATRINTAGAFWKRSNATILTGVAENELDQVIALYRKVCSTAKDAHPSAGVLFVLPVACALKF